MAADPSREKPTSRNVDTIAQLEHAAKHDRSRADRISDAIVRFGSSIEFVLLHVVFFAAWFGINSGKLPLIFSFDPYPYGFLSTVVSLEAIFLTIFVLVNQRQMTRRSERRAHLDLQVNLLAEQEMTMVLKMLRQICDKLEIQREQESDELRELYKKTDIHTLIDQLERKLPE